MKLMKKKKFKIIFADIIVTHKSKIILFQLTFHIKTLSFSLQEVEEKE